MKVLFKKHVVNVGKIGEIKEVKPWYATNFLFPNGSAVEYTHELERKLKSSQKKDESHRRQLVEDRHAIVETLNWKTLKFQLKWDSKKVFWAISEKDILAAIKKEFKLELTKKHVQLMDGHIKKIWSHDAYIKLGKDAMAKMTIEISWQI